MAALAENLAAVRASIVEACTRAHRDPAQVRLIAVTKTQDTSVLAPLAGLGVRDIGENRLEEIERKHAALPPGMRLHAIGRLQSRQIPRIVAASAVVHSLCDPSHVERLDAANQRKSPPVEVFLQVNVSGEAAKSGVDPSALDALLSACRGRSFVVVGLMTMAPAAETGATAEEIRACFRRLAELGRERSLPRLSMGMSQDFAVAVEEGATDIRVGTRLFA